MEKTRLHFEIGWVAKEGSSPRYNLQLVLDKGVRVSNTVVRIGIVFLTTAMEQEGVEKIGNDCGGWLENDGETELKNHLRCGESEFEDQKKIYCRKCDHRL